MSALDAEPAELPVHPDPAPTPRQDPAPLQQSPEDPTQDPAQDPAQHPALDLTQDPAQHPALDSATSENTGADPDALPDPDQEVEEAPSSRLRGWLRLGSTPALAAALVIAALLRDQIASALAAPRAQTAVSVGVSVLVQAVPFLLLGALASAVSSAFRPTLDRFVPRSPLTGIPVAALGGAALSMGKDDVVGAAATAISRGAPISTAVAFMLAGPAANPVALVATAVAFPGHPSMVVARLVAGLVVAVVSAVLWHRLGRPEWLAPQLPEAAGRGWPAFWAGLRRGFLRGGGMLVIGAAAVAGLTVLAPANWLGAIAARPAFAVIAVALLAVLLCVGSGADAFVAAALTPLSLTARLVYQVTSATVDLRLFAAQNRVLGAGIALRLAPLTLVVGVVVSALVGWLLWT